MSSGTAQLRGGAFPRSRTRTFDGLRANTATGPKRTIQIVLGVIWLVDAGLQFQSFMYSKGFIDMLHSMTPGQPGWLASSVNWAANLASPHLTIFNTLFALTQAAI